MNTWEFYPIKTNKGGFDTSAYGYGWCEFNYVVLAEKEVGEVFYGIYGYGNTEDEAMKDAQNKTNNFEKEEK